MGIHQRPQTINPTTHTQWTHNKSYNNSANYANPKDNAHSASEDYKATAPQANNPTHTELHHKSFVSNFWGAVQNDMERNKFNQINRQNENICDYTIKDVPENAHSFRA